METDEKQPRPKATWNYRVVKKRIPVGLSPEPTVDIFGIHEAHYHGEKVVNVTVEPCEPTGDDLEELKSDWLRMGEAFNKPVLSYDEI